MSCLGLMAGLVLDGIRKSRHEASRLSYMRHPADPRRLRPRPRPGVAVMQQMRSSCVAGHARCVQAS